VSHSTTDHGGRDSPRPLQTSEPFHTYVEVPVAGGALTVACAGPPPEAGRPAVLALHGMTSCHMAYRTVARLLVSSAPVSLLAPDMRGRGRSADLPEPYGMDVHIADLIAVLDFTGADRAIVVGHSMGCNIAARLAMEHPERVASVVLLDSGLPLHPEDMDLDGPEGELYGLLDRLMAAFDSVEEYERYWRAHPALKDVWDDDIEAFMRCDYVEDEDGVRCVVNVEPVVSDLEDLAFDGVTADALTQVRVPVRLMRAERGLLDDDPVIPLSQLEAFRRDNPHVSVEMVPDVNHYTILMGGGHGPRRVAAILAELATGNRPG
jgi:pimeloyl-ACP methyl ester carboxylesterase